MAYGSMHEISPWRRSSLKIPPKSPGAWLSLATWQMWMGMIVCALGALGLSLIVSAPDRIVTISDLGGCYAPPPVALPCERIVYRGGLLYAAFSVLSGVMLIGVAAWYLWELWNAVEPKPITDDFLKLLDDSFGRDWRNPLTWPWARVLWAYGFTLAGAILTAGVGITIWTLVAAAHPAKVPAARVETSQSFSLAP